MINKDGLGYYGQPVRKTPVKVCALPFYDLSINHKGILNACALDWELKTNFGDVNNQSLYEIWNGKKFNDFRRMQLRKERGDDELCGKCDALEYCNVDNIDVYADELLKKFNSLP